MEHQDAVLDDRAVEEQAALVGEVGVPLFEAPLEQGDLRLFLATWGYL